MEILDKTERYNYLKSLENRKHTPYDYAENGLLKKLLPTVIINSENDITQSIIKYIEYILIHLMRYVDELKHFKDWNWRG